MKNHEKIKSNLNKRYKRERMKAQIEQQGSIVLEPLDVNLSVCKVEDYTKTDISKPFCFIGNTDEEKSLVCPTEIVPDNATDRDDG